MARVERLNKTIIPVLSDPAAIGRAAQADPSAGLLAQGIGQVAGVGADILQQQEAEERRIKDLQEQTEMTRRMADYQNKSFEVVNVNRDSFKQTPDKSFDALNESLRKLGDSYIDNDLSIENQERLRKSQESVIGRFGLQQRQWALTQATSNTNNNIQATSTSYLQSAALAGKEGDFQRLQDITNDVSALTERAKETFDAKSVEKFASDLEKGIVENFSDGLMFHNPEEFLQKLNDGFFDDVFTPEEKSDKKDEVQKHIKNLNEQAKFDQQMTFLGGNADLLTAFKAGEIDLNVIDDLIAAGKISPEVGEQARDIALKGPILAETKVSTYTDLWARKQELVNKISKGKTAFKKKELDDAVRLQAEIMGKLNAGEITTAEAKGLSKSLELGIRGRIEAGLRGAFDIGAANDHYTTAFERFQEYTDDVNLQVDLFKSYVQAADLKKVDDLEGQDEKNEEANKIASSIIKGKTSAIAPATAAMDDLPNNIISKNGDQVYTGAQLTKQKADAIVKTEGKIMTRPDGTVWRVFPNGTGQRIK